MASQKKYQEVVKNAVDTVEPLYIKSAEERQADLIKAKIARKVALGEPVDYDKIIAHQEYVSNSEVPTSKEGLPLRVADPHLGAGKPKDDKDDHFYWDKHFEGLTGPDRLHCYIIKQRPLSESQEPYYEIIDSSNQYKTGSTNLEHLFELLSAQYEAKRAFVVTPDGKIDQRYKAGIQIGKW